MREAGAAAAEPVRHKHRMHRQLQRPERRPCSGNADASLAPVHVPLSLSRNKSELPPSRRSHPQLSRLAALPPSRLGASSLARPRGRRGEAERARLGAPRSHARCRCGCALSPPLRRVLACLAVRAQRQRLSRGLAARTGTGRRLGQRGAASGADVQLAVWQGDAPLKAATLRQRDTTGNNEPESG